MRRADIEALRHSCPECNVPPDRLCVYIWPRKFDYLDPRVDKTYPMVLTEDIWNLLSFRSRGTQALMLRAGTPTQHCHNGRINVGWALQKRRQRLAEYARLRDWLLAYGDIFEVGKYSSS